jgi:choice-of-anchor A domain-containing protein
VLLGPAADFNLFSLGAITADTSSTGGRMAGGGPVTLADYSVGASLPNSHGTRDDLISGTDLTFTNGQVARGNAVYGGTGTFTNVGFPNGSPRQGSVLDFPAARQFLETASARWAGLATTGTITWQSNRYALVGSNASLNVFNISGANLAQATSLTITAPAGSTVLVNVDGSSLTLANFGIRIRGTSQQKVLYNFAAVTSLNVTNLGVPGSILAPHAATHFTNGQIDGQLIAASFTGTTTLHHQPFTGCLP